MKLLIAIFIVISSSSKTIHDLDLSSLDLSLRDVPPVGDSIHYLDGPHWRASRPDVGIKDVPANVPGDLLTVRSTPVLFPHP